MLRFDLSLRSPAMPLRGTLIDDDAVLCRDVAGVQLSYRPH